MFEFEKICTILTAKNCERCKFAKTESEWIAEKNKAKQRLEEMGLECVIVVKGHDAIVTTRKVEILDDNERGRK